MKIRVNTDKLKVYLYKNFDLAFSRPWDELPEATKENWTEVAEEMAEELITQEIVEVVA